MNAALMLRKALNAKRPKFKRQEAGQRRENKGSWRKPRGLHSKMGVRKAGHAAMVEPGYRGPRIARGLHQGGLKPVLVRNSAQLASVGKNSGAVIVSSVGLAKRIGIVKAASEKGVPLLNIKNSKEWLEKANALLAKRKEKRTKTVALEQKLEQKKPEQKPERKKEEEETVEEAKKEYDKLLTKRG